jgi:putative Ca2+/H+ antiporter (TMEM165/GDT1 family)
MDWRVFLTVFGSMLLMELGDKTQLATVSFAASQQSRVSVFLGAAAALVLTSFLGVVVGEVVASVVPAVVVKRACGGLFVVIGVLLIAGWF